MNNSINKLQQLFIEHKLPHTIILTGKHTDLVQEGLVFAKWMLCLNRGNADACGSCSLCKLLQAETAPDFMQIIPSISGNSKSIKIEEVREVIQFVQVKPQFSTVKVVLLCGVEHLNMQAANALLKTLEEPPSSVHIILTVTKPELLLDTIISRCFVVNIEPNFNEILPNKLMVENLLIDLYDTLIIQDIDLVTTIDKWMHSEGTELLTCLWFILVELIRCNCKLRCNYIELDKVKIKTISANQSFRQLWSILDNIIEVRKNVLLGKQVNIQLFLEKLMIDWEQGLNHGRR